MAINNDLQVIKKEFENDEKILESAFRIERFFKKYKYILIVVVLVLVLWGVYIGVYSFLEEKKAAEINEIYRELTQSPNNEVLRQSLKDKAPELYDLFLYAQIIQLANTQNLNGSNLDFEALQNSSNQIVKEIAEYVIASKSQDSAKLDAIDSAFGDLAKIQEAYLAIKAQDITKARKILSTIPKDSQMAGNAELLRHYGITTMPLESNDMSIEEIAPAKK